MTTPTLKTDGAAPSLGSLTPALWPSRIKVLRRGSLSLRVDTRSCTVGLLFLLFATAISCWSLTIGESALPLSDVLAALTGHADPGVERIVLGWRLPRILLALLAGAALALGGAVFQTLTRNPLGSPDIIGFNTGAYTGALLSMLVFHGGQAGTVTGALLGGTFTGVLVYFLALRRGLSGYRLIVIGIGIGSLLGAVNGYLMISVRLESAISAAIWGAGSLATATWNDVVPVAVALVVLVPILMALSRSTHLLTLGDDAAHSRGVNISRLRLLLIFIGVALTAAVTAVAGPIAFVALVAPQLALRLARTPGIPLLPSALMGAALLAISDLIARTIIAPAQVPVGIVTVVLGGGYLVWLLISHSRKS